MINLNFLKQFTKEDPKKMKRYISLYLDVAPKTFEEMRKNLSNNDYEQLRINAHSLKPQVDFMGIKNLKEELIKIEDAVLMNNIEMLKDLFNSSHTLSVESEQLLRKVLEQL